MEKKEILEKILGEYGYGETFGASTAWVKENDSEIYDALLDIMQEFVDDESNSCNEEDLQEFEAGNWNVEYVISSWGCDCPEILITAGRDGQQIANQPAWIEEKLDDLDRWPLEKYLKMIN